MTLNMSFDVTKAVNWIIKNSSASSKHVCAKHVRMAMEAGGLSTAGRPGWAWEYINWLGKVGWKNISLYNNANKQTPISNVQPGDIAVYQKPGKGGSEPGHICMYTGSQWISDFRQNQAMVYQGTTNIYIFRYTGERSTSGDIISSGDRSSATSSNGEFASGNTMSTPVTPLEGGTLTMGLNKKNTAKGLILGMTIPQK